MEFRRNGHRDERRRRVLIEERRGATIRRETGSDKSRRAEAPDEQRQVLELAFFRGMTQSEIAASTGIPLGTVKTRTLLAMKKLRNALSTDLRELL